jgi:hypothetical protein
MTVRKGFMIVCGVLAMCASACSKSNAKKTFPVTGTVLAGNKPVAGALVVFHPVGDNSPESVKSRATTKPDGTFTLATYGTDDGAPAGEYAVTVEQWLAGVRPDDPPSNRLNPRFAKADSSGFKATVNTGTNEPQTFQVSR